MVEVAFSVRLRQLAYVTTGMTLSLQGVELPWAGAP
jgi:hypothetical protein